MVSQYDGLADAYGKIHALDLRTDLEEPAVFRLLREVKGTRALDLGCGDGLYSRLLARRGAAEVLGVDISQDMLRAARAHAEGTELPIRYVAGDVAEITALGRFDIAVAAYLLHYADSTPRLGRMCRRIYEHLVPGGRLVAVVANPAIDPKGAAGPKYGFTVRPMDALEDGAETVLDLHTEPPFSIRYRYFRRSTYEQALREAGFRDIVWTRFEAPAHADRAYWQRYLDNPHVVLVSATR